MCGRVTYEPARHIKRFCLVEGHNEVVRRRTACPDHRRVGARRPVVRDRRKRQNVRAVRGLRDAGGADPARMRGDLPGIDTGGAANQGDVPARRGDRDRAVRTRGVGLSPARPAHETEGSGEIARDVEREGTCRATRAAGDVATRVNPGDEPATRARLAAEAGSRRALRPSRPSRPSRPGCPSRPSRPLRAGLAPADGELRRVATLAGAGID